MIGFPFWLVLPAEAHSSSSSNNSQPMAFSSVAGMSRYLAAKTSGEWNVRLVNRYNAQDVVGELQRLGFSEICYEVSETESAQPYAVEEVLKAAEHPS